MQTALFTLTSFASTVLSTEAQYVFCFFSFHILSNISNLSSSLPPFLLLLPPPLQHSISTIYSDRLSLHAMDLHFLTT